MTATDALDALMQGNERFRTGAPHAQRYCEERLAEIAVGQQPFATVLTCIDSRVAPEIVFDQPLGAMFAARTPGNVNADSVKWMIDIAVDDVRVPLILVMAHTGCLAITQVVNGEFTGPGGHLRAQIAASLTRAKSQNPSDLLMATIRENVYVTMERLAEESHELRRAMERGTTGMAGAVYHMATGLVEVLPKR